MTNKFIQPSRLLLCAAVIYFTYVSLIACEAKDQKKESVEKIAQWLQQFKALNTAQKSKVAEDFFSQSPQKPMYADQVKRTGGCPHRGPPPSMGRGVQEDRDLSFCGRNGQPSSKTSSKKQRRSPTGRCASGNCKQSRSRRNVNPVSQMYSSDSNTLSIPVVVVLFMAVVPFLFI